MPMDNTDLKLVREILAAVRSGDETTHKLLRLFKEQDEKQGQDMVKAFNRVADSLDRMTRELQALREDLKPAMRKPKLSDSRGKAQAAAHTPPAAKKAAP